MKIDLLDDMKKFYIFTLTVNMSLTISNDNFCKPSHVSQCTVHP